jgi:phage shock protein E
MNTNVAIVVIAAVTVAVFFWLRRGDITGERARDLVAGGAKLVDVRSPEEFAAGHLPGAINIPVHELAGRETEIGPASTPVIVYCRSGARSSRAKGLLRRAGFGMVHNLGAMSRW